MLCSDLARMEVEAISAKASAEAAAMRMREELVGFLVVCDEDLRVQGVLTDRDIAMRVCAEKRPGSVLVGEVMSRDVIACRPGDPISRAEELMAQHRKHRLVVTDAENKLLGVISLTDIAQLEEPLRVARLLREISTRSFRAVPRSGPAPPPSSRPR